ncbi:MAG: diacylglycerol kinase family protein [Candidatus Omnitrophica bacterium]|nr:diacylglycerol kinase family protein [Candidatus Omnitrophota bacterium]
MRRKIVRHVFRLHGFMESFRLAADGVYYLFLYHRNMRIIFLLGAAALLAGVYLQLRGIELVALFITVTLVFMAEIFNTAIEMMMNMLSARYRLRIKLVKDIAAAVVLISSINAVIVGGILFLGRLKAAI